MMIDITNRRLEEVSYIVSKMEKFGLSSRIERINDRFLLILYQNPKENNARRNVTILDW